MVQKPSDSRVREGRDVALHDAESAILDHRRDAGRTGLLGSTSVASERSNSRDGISHGCEATNGSGDYGFHEECETSIHFGTSSDLQERACSRSERLVRPKGRVECTPRRNLVLSHIWRAGTGRWPRRVDYHGARD